MKVNVERREYKTLFGNLRAGEVFRNPGDEEIYMVVKDSGEIIEKQLRDVAAVCLADGELVWFCYTDEVVKVEGSFVGKEV